ncbi:surface protease GP63 [Trypanosoma conorhini]|uniref:Leishmanolysin-like peptidase n=1 Tax=Trypanosoma conorhini TaxID=83891 RepID=A0A3R7LKG6_9TRYP|nr:surface protease GP63 [Trypanosoma conorhini]RNF16164.1 surface protease GP63 [Trypanosoma conorhini]
MHRRLRAMPLLPLAVLLLLLTVHRAAGCLAAAHRCNFDEAMRKSGPLPTAVVREVPRRGEGAAQAYTAAAATVGGGKSNEGWAPIRIVVSMEDLKDPSKYCGSKTEQRPNFEGLYQQCFSETILTADKNKTLVNEVIPVAVQLHAERLLVQRTKGELSVPQFVQGGNCQYFTVPQSHHTVGVSDADVVLYVAAGSGSTSWAVPCAVDAHGRPVAGVLHVFLSDVDYVMSAARIIAHELGHTLGFGVEEMRNHNLLLSLPDVRGSANPAMVVNSPAALKETRKHYGCDTLQGMELRMQDDGTPSSHWSQRNAKDELMSPYDSYSGGYYTALTMAMFEDLGYYKAVWGMEEPMAWGNNSGCEFLDKQCAGDVHAAYPDMFCEVSDKSLHCTSDRQALGKCVRNVGNVAANPPERCSVLFPTIGDDGNYDGYRTCILKGSDVFHGSLSGGNSWCLDGESLEAQANKDGSWQTGVGAVCAQVLCGFNEVMVKYLGGSDFELCPEGGFLEPKSPQFKGGKIKCPRYEEVCTIAANGSTVEVSPPPGSGGDSDDSDGDDDYYCEEYYDWPDGASAVTCTISLVLIAVLLLAKVLVLF